MPANTEERCENGTYSARGCLSCRGCLLGLLICLANGLLLREGKNFIYPGDCLPEDRRCLPS